MSEATVYGLDGGTITATDASSGVVLWAVRPLGARVVDIAGLGAFGGVVVLLDYMEMGSGPANNLIRLDRNGAVVWQAPLPTGEPSDAYVEFSLDSEGWVSASSWSGWRVRLDAANGEIIQKLFSK
jgi:outer membrane protein assembly factor BamB